jgi:hypothetical protein
VINTVRETRRLNGMDPERSVRKGGGAGCTIAVDIKKA